MSVSAEGPNQPENAKSSQLPTSDAPANAEGSLTPQAAPEDELPEVPELTPELVAEDAQRNDFMLRLVVVLLALLMSLTTISSTRTLVSIRAGEATAENGFLPPKVDPFSTTAADQPWLYPEWLFDLVVSQLAKLGFAPLTILQCLIVTAAVFLLGSIRRPGVPSWWASICLALAVIVLVPRISLTTEIVTVLGTAVCLFTLWSYGQAGRRSALVAYVVAMFLWSQLDPRAYIGLMLGLCAAIGRSVQSSNEETSSGGDGGKNAPAGTAKPYWFAWLAAAVACMVHPLLWEVYRVPLALYTEVYPQMRGFSPLIVGPLDTMGRWAFSGSYWRVSPDLIAALVLLTFAIGALALNFRNARLTHGLWLFVGLFLAAITRHDLPIAAAIWAVVATLNAQAWYARSFSQQYSIAWRERLFSVGGRAVTAVALFSLAYFFLVGTLTSQSRPRVGFGLALVLQTYAEGMEQDVDDLPEDLAGFNFTFEQGDLMVWAKQKSFIDSRILLFATTPVPDADPLPGETGEDSGSPVNPARSLADKHQYMFRGLYVAIQESLGADVTTAEANRQDWTSGTELYDVKYLMLPTPGSNLTIEMFRSIQIVPNSVWRLTNLGYTSAIFFNARKVQGDATLADLAQASLANHSAVAEVFDEEIAIPLSESTLAARSVFPRRPTWIQRLLTPTIAASHPGYLKAANHSLQAGVFMSLPTQNVFDRFNAVLGLISNSYLQIRNAHRAIAADSGNFEAWLLLADGYANLLVGESEIIQSVGVQNPSQRRYIQAVAAYHQALKIEPDSLVAHSRLIRIYNRQRMLDLQLRHVEAVVDLMPIPDAENEEQLELYEQTLEEARTLKDRIGSIRDQIESAAADELDYRIAVQQAAGGGCLLLALEYLEKWESEASAEEISHPKNLLNKARLLQQVGEVEEAYELAAQAFAQIEQEAATAGSPQARFTARTDDWLDERAKFELLAGRLQEAATAYRAYADTLRTLPIDLALGFAPMAVRSSEPDSLTYLQATAPMAALVQQNMIVRTSLLAFLPRAAMAYYEAALTELEIGNPAAAEELLEASLDADPDSPLRPLIVFYLQRMQSESVQGLNPGVPPGQLIPVWSDMFATDPEATGAQVQPAATPARAEKPVSTESK